DVVIVAMTDFLQVEIERIPGNGRVGTVPWRLSRAVSTVGPCRPLPYGIHSERKRSAFQCDDPSKRLNEVRRGSCGPVADLAGYSIVPKSGHGFRIKTMCKRCAAPSFQRILMTCH